jgi:hypothetical protein
VRIGRFTFRPPRNCYASRGCGTCCRRGGVYTRGSDWTTSHLCSNLIGSCSKRSDWSQATCTVNRPSFSSGLCACVCLRTHPRTRLRWGGAAVLGLGNEHSSFAGKSGQGGKSWFYRGGLRLHLHKREAKILTYPFQMASNLNLLS